MQINTPHVLAEVPAHARSMVRSQKAHSHEIQKAHSFQKSTGKGLSAKFLEF